LNYKLSKNIATEITKTFYEVILAPEIDEEAKKILASKKNLRVLKYNRTKKTEGLSATFMQKTFLLQDENISSLSESNLKVVTKIEPTDEEVGNLLFANQVCKHVKSNAIVISNKKKNTWYWRRSNKSCWVLRNCM
jgi:phosphoribosylaminoimidazolecarboxamide formyltransferase/IMP cyclohydrolase